VGAQDELIFDGESLVFSANGDCLGQGAAFKEDLVLVDLEASSPIEIKVIFSREPFYT